ncbi:MAG: DNA repair protein RecO [Clostridia bacterium]|nr:DNA repair protein RecO [Clostridia bacterium]
MGMMSDEKVSGIVVRFADYKDYHKMLTIFTPKYGMLSVLSPASKRPKSPLRAGSETFVFGNFIIKSKGEYKTLTEVEIIDSFYDLRMDIEALSCAYYMRDFCEFASQEDQDSPEIFSLFIRCLTILCHNGVDPIVVRYAFEIKMMGVLGLAAALNKCIECGKDSEKTHFNIEEGGAVCQSCSHNKAATIKVSPQAVNTLKIISELPLDKLGVVKLKANIKTEIDDFWSKYLRWHLDKNFRTADFMDRSKSF